MGKPFALSTRIASEGPDWATVIRTRHDMRLVVVGLTLLAASAAAQNDQNDHSCDKAAKIVANGHPAKKEVWAYSLLITCSGGATTLAGAWSSPPADTDAFHALAGSSYSVADHRIVSAVIAVALDSHYPRRQRWTALNVAVAQFNPAFGIRPLGGGGLLDGDLGTPV